MKVVASKNPFTASLGVIPIHLAGRKDELDEMVLALDRIKDSHDAKGEGRDVLSGPVILVGPRGIGKTVLLERASEMAQEREVDVLELVYRNFEAGLDDLISFISPPKIPAFKKYDAKASILEAVSVGGGVERHIVETKSYLEVALQERMEKSKRPLLILIDEAHTIPQEMMAAFCVATQQSIRKRKPLALFMAGTPVLRSRLREQGTTFMDRAEFLEFNLLSRAEAEEALVETFAASGKTVVPDALAKMVKWSDNYPYFIQLVGKWTWKVTDQRSSATVSVEDVKEGIKKATEVRVGYYTQRMAEIVDQKLTRIALRVMDAMAGYDDGIEFVELYSELMKGEQGMSEDESNEAIKKMLELGMIYMAGSSMVTPGIPSLFSFLASKLDKLNPKHLNHH